MFILVKVRMVLMSYVETTFVFTSTIQSTILGTLIFLRNHAHMCG